MTRNESTENGYCETKQVNQMIVNASVDKISDDRRDVVKTRRCTTSKSRPLQREHRK